MEKRCEFCNKTGSEAIIEGAIYEGKPMDLCRACAEINGALVIKKPSEEELSILSKPTYKFAELRQKIKEGKRVDESPRMNIPVFNPEKVRKKVWMTLEEKAALRAEKIEEKFGEKKERGIVVEEPIIEKSDSADINFKSDKVRIGDLRRLKEKFFGRKKAVIEEHIKTEPDTFMPETEDKGIEIIDIEKEE